MLKRRLFIGKNKNNLFIKGVDVYDTHVSLIKLDKIDDHLIEKPIEIYTKDIKDDILNGHYDEIDLEFQYKGSELKFYECDNDIYHQEWKMNESKDELKLENFQFSEKEEPKRKYVSPPSEISFSVGNLHKHQKDKES